MSYSRFVANAFSRKYLLWTNMTIGTGFTVIADVCQQRIEKVFVSESEFLTENSNLIDWRRMSSMGLQGFLYAVSGHVWYHFLDRKLPGNAVKTVIKKVGLELAIGPLFFAEAFILVGVLEKKELKECWANYIDSLPQMFAVSCLFWSPLQAVNFYLLPTRYRVVYVSTITFISGLFFSYFLHRNNFRQTKQSNVELPALNTMAAHSASNAQTAQH